MTQPIQPAQPDDNTGIEFDSQTTNDFPTFVDKLLASNPYTSQHISNAAAYCAVLDVGVASLLIDSIKAMTSSSAYIKSLKASYKTLVSDDDKHKKFINKLNLIVRTFEIGLRALETKATPTELGIVNDAFNPKGTFTEAYVYGPSQIIILLKADKDKYSKALDALNSLYAIIQLPSTKASTRLKVWNVFSAVIQELAPLSSMWWDAIVSDRRMNSEYDYEKITRTLSRKDDATGDVSHIEKMVNSVITSGAKNSSLN